jgi:hypothetical protein
VAAATKSSIGRLIYSPLTAAWLLAIAASTLIAVLTLGPKFRFAPARSNQIPAQLEITPESPNPKPDESDVVASKPEDPPVQVVPPTVEAEFITVSALEPANMSGPLPWPPPAVVKEEPVKPVVKIDIPAKMAQKIYRYYQPKVRRRELLDVLEEQLGAPIRYDEDELGTGSLDETVIIDLSNTTIGDVIKTVADAADWELVIEDTGIRLKPRQNSVAP